jgi:hypothetical protein
MLDPRYCKLEDGTFRTHMWPGIYPVFYITRDERSLCPTCVNNNRDEVATNESWQVIAVQINHKNNELYCDHCSKRIESISAEEECFDTCEG